MKRLFFLSILSLATLTSCIGEDKKDLLVDLIDMNGNVIAEFKCDTKEIRTFDNDSPFVIGKWYSKEDFISYSTNDGIAAIDLPEIIRNLERQCE